MIPAVLDNVDNYTEFLTVNELEYELRKFQRKDLIKISQIGNSRDGYPILSASVGNGKKAPLFSVFRTLMSP